MAAAYLCVLGLACATGCAQVRPDDLLKATVPAADYTARYGADALQFGELRLPATKGPHAVAMLVHGGCWVDRLAGADPRITTFELLRPLAAALARAGVATWNVEYRRAGSPGGGWPATFLDVAAAMDYLRQLATKRGLDLDHVVVAGHSAGGQLALWIAARPKLAPSSVLYVKDALRVRAAVDIDGPPDLASAQPVEMNFCPVAGISQVMGGSATERPERYRDASATAFLPLGVVQEIVASALLRRSGDLAGRYTQQATAKGDRVETLALERSGHFDMLDPSTPEGKAVVGAITKLAGVAAARE